MATVVNSIPRTINQKLSEVRSVLDFGVIGDGVTDDLQNIKNAIGSLPQNLFATLAISTVANVTGTAVTWVSGAKFDRSLLNQQIGISGTNYQVVNVIGTTGLTLATAAGTLTNTPITYYSNVGEIVFPDPPGGAYLISSTLFVPPFVSLIGRSNIRVQIVLAAGAATGTTSVVTVSGTTINWVSGATFPATLAGMRVIIAGNPYDILTVNSSTSMTATTAPSGGGAMAVETWAIQIIPTGDIRGPIPAGPPYTENSRFENLWINGGWADGASNPYSSCIYFPVAQISTLRNVLLTEGGQRGHFNNGGAFVVYDNVWSNSHGAGPGFDLWNCHDVVINGLWCESVNYNYDFVDGDGDYMAGTRFQNCQNVLITAWDSENTALPLKIAGCANVVFLTAFFNGNLTIPPIGCKIKDLLYNGATSNGVVFLRAQAIECATAIEDTSISAYTVQPRNITIPGAPSWHNIVDVSGTAVTATSGTPFTQAMVGLFPGINGVFGPTVASVTDSTHLTLSSSGGTLTGATFAVVPINYLIQYVQDYYIPSLIGRTGTQLAISDPSDDAAVNFQGQPIRFQGTSSGVSTIQGVPTIGTVQTITNIDNPGAGPITITIPNNDYSTGQRVLLSGITGQTALNAEWTITVVEGGATGTFLLNGAVGDGTASTGGTAQQPADFLIATAFDSIRIQGGENDANPRDVKLQIGDTGASVLLDSSTNDVTITGNAITIPITVLNTEVTMPGSSSGVDAIHSGAATGGIWEFISEFDDILIQGGIDDADAREVVLRSGVTVGPSVTIGGTSGNQVVVDVANNLVVNGPSGGGNLLVEGSVVQFSDITGGVLQVDSSGFVSAVSVLPQSEGGTGQISVAAALAAEGGITSSIFGVNTVTTNSFTYVSGSIVAPSGGGLCSWNTNSFTGVTSVTSISFPFTNGLLT